MNTPVIIPTEREGVVLRELTEADDRVYLESYDYSRSEIESFETEEERGKYRTIEEVVASRLKAQLTGKLRLGIWDGETFVGMVGRTPLGEEAEVGYWLDSRRTGHGYATLATRAVIKYDEGKFNTVFANVVEGNDASVKVLVRSGFREVAREAGKRILHLVK